MCGVKCKMECPEVSKVGRRRINGFVQMSWRCFSRSCLCLTVVFSHLCCALILHLCLPHLTCHYWLCTSGRSSVHTRMKEWSGDTERSFILTFNPFILPWLCCVHVRSCFWAPYYRKCSWTQMKVRGFSCWSFKNTWKSGENLCHGVSPQKNCLCMSNKAENSPQVVGTSQDHPQRVHNDVP